MKKTDLVKEDKSYYTADKNCQLISFMRYSYMAASGEGEPAGNEFIDKVSRLYPVAFGVKKIMKKTTKTLLSLNPKGCGGQRGIKNFYQHPGINGNGN